MPIISKGQKVHIITRRLFDGDIRRHFAGVIEEVSEPLVRAVGYVFVFDETKNTFVRRDEVRTRVFSLAEAGFIINILPDYVDITNLQYRKNLNGQKVLTDGRTFSLDVSEFDFKS